MALIHATCVQYADVHLPVCHHVDVILLLVLLQLLPHHGDGPVKQCCPLSLECPPLQAAPEHQEGCNRAALVEAKGLLEGRQQALLLKAAALLRVQVQSRRIRAVAEVVLDAVCSIQKQYVLATVVLEAMLMSM